MHEINKKLTTYNDYINIPEVTVGKLTSEEPIGEISKEQLIPARLAAKTIRTEEMEQDLHSMQDLADLMTETYFQDLIEKTGETINQLVETNPQLLSELKHDHDQENEISESLRDLLVTDLFPLLEEEFVHLDTSKYEDELMKVKDELEKSKADLGELEKQAAQSSFPEELNKDIENLNRRIQELKNSNLKFTKNKR